MARNEQAPAADLASPAWIERIGFLNGLEVDLAPGSIVVFVGPNNVGKSQTLLMLAARLRGLNQDGFDPVAELSIGVQVKDDEDDVPLLDWLAAHVPKTRPTGGRAVYSDGAGNNINAGDAENQARGLRPGAATLGVVGRLVTLFANADRRLGLVSPQGPIDRDEQPPSHPVQALYNNARAMESLSQAFDDAFGSGLVFDSVSGQWQLRIGGPIEWAVDNNGFPLDAIRETVREMPLVHLQGHGVRSYAGLLAELAAARHLFVLVDEPEAFLHPPQARQLGRHLVDVKLGGTQAFVATHSANLLRGILEGASQAGADTTVVRLTRAAGDTLGADVLEGGDVAALWQDPILRYSDVLEGIFHHSVVICESDPDCALYEAVVQSHGLGVGGRDRMFVQASGVARIPVVARALTSVGVTAAAIVDADVLLNPAQVERVAAALGHPLDEAMLEGLERTKRDLLQQLDGQPELKTDALRAEIDELLDGFDDDRVSGNLASRIRAAAENKVSSKLVKRQGITVLRGEQYEFARGLLEALGELGVFVVPRGELESWFRAVGGHGTGHVAGVLDQGLHEDEAETQELREFLTRMLQHLDQ